MKTLIATLVSFLFLVSCTEENEAVYSVDPSLAPYVDTFYSNNPGVPRNLIAELNDFKTQAISKGETTQGQNYLYFSETLFNSFTASGMQSEIQEHVDRRLLEVFRLVK